MSWTTALAAYVATLILFLGIDAVWLGKIANRFYAAEMGELMRPQPLMSVAAIFYAVYVFGIVYFAIKPAREADLASLALINGALLGFLAYGTYDMTNLATIRDWSWRLAVVDWIWGTILTGVSAFGGYWVSRLL